MALQSAARQLHRRSDKAPGIERRYTRVALLVFCIQVRVDFWTDFSDLRDTEGSGVNLHIIPNVPRNRYRQLSNVRKPITGLLKMEK